jgi:hypothetical protein
MRTLNIFEKYSEYTGLRHCNISDNSGEDFYHKILNKEFTTAFKNKEKLVVVLDQVDGYASSFLDEAFGNLVYDFTLEEVKKNVEIISEQEPHWKTMIEEKTYIQWEKRRKNNEVPKVTANHNAWFRLINNEIISKIWESSAN